MVKVSWPLEFLEKSYDDFSNHCARFNIAVNIVMFCIPLYFDVRLYRVECIEMEVYEWKEISFSTVESNLMPKKLVFFVLNPHVLEGF